MADEFDPYEQATSQLEEGYPDPFIFGDPAVKEGASGLEIVGKALRKEVGTTKFGPCDILVLEAKDGKLWSVWLTHTALVNKLMRARPDVGDIVGIKQLGERVSKGGDDYMDYHVVVIPMHQQNNLLTWGAPPELPEGEVAEAEVVDDPTEGVAGRPGSRQRVEDDGTF